MGAKEWLRPGDLCNNLEKNSLGVAGEYRGNEEILFLYDAKFSANSAEFSDDFIEVYLFVGCHKTGAKRLVARHYPWPDKCVDVHSGIEESFPEEKGFFLVFDQHRDDRCPRWHKGESGFEQCLANVIGIGNEPLHKFGFSAYDIEGGQNGCDTCRCGRSAEDK